MSEARRFASLLSQVARDVTRRQSSEVCCGDVTLEQFQTLRAVSAGEPTAPTTPMSLGALSAALRVDLSTMSRNVTVLERDGYLARARSADDGRVVHVKLTVKGRRALETLRCDERDVLGDVYDGLPAAARSTVTDALQALATALEAPSDGACCPPRLVKVRAR
jgi:DNA-binding MarR family transcriptional regulator